MKKIQCLLFSLCLGSSALPARAQPPEQNGATEGKATATRRIVRVLSTSDDATGLEIEERQRLVFVGEGENSESVLVSGFSAKRGYLGVQTLDLTPELRMHFGTGTDAGVMVSRVLEDSPAARAGLAPGDILVEVDGERVKSGIQLERLIAPLGDQTGVNLEISRNGSTRTVPVTIVERKRPTIDIGRLALSSPETIQEFVWVGPEEIEEHVIRIDPKGLDEALRELEVRIEKPDFLERFGPLGQSRLDMQRRILELEQRLETLERQLEEFSGD